MAGSDILVIGGGLIGCSAALHLARRGFTVRLLEQHRVGRHASGTNIGGVRRLLRKPAELPLSLAAAEYWPRMAEFVGEDCGFRAIGQIAVAATEAGADQLRARVAALGLPHEVWLDRAVLFDRLPALHRSCQGGLMTETDGIADPAQVTAAFARAVVAAGVTLAENARALSFQRREGVWQIETIHGTLEADAIVNCGGGWGGRLAALLGDALPVTPIAPMMLITTPVAPFLTMAAQGINPALSVRQAPDGRVWIGGGHRATPDLVTGTVQLDEDQIAINLAAAGNLFPILKEVRIDQAKAGIEAWLPDDLPVLGPSLAAERCFHAFAFAGSGGYQMSPVVGEILADLVEHGRSKLPIEPFAVDRFSV